jgi:hypothetical protein
MMPLDDMQHHQHGTGGVFLHARITGTKVITYN